MVWFVMTRALLRSGVGVSGLASGRESDWQADWCTGLWCVVGGVGFEVGS